MRIMDIENFQVYEIIKEVINIYKKKIIKFMIFLDDKYYLKNNNNFSLIKIYNDKIT